MYTCSVRLYDSRGRYIDYLFCLQLDLLSLALYSKFTNRHYTHTLRPLLLYCYNYKDQKFLYEQSGFRWDKETRMITISKQAQNDIYTVSYPLLGEGNRGQTLIRYIQYRKSYKQHKNNPLPYTYIFKELYDLLITTSSNVYTPTIYTLTI